MTSDTRSRRPKRERLEARITSEQKRLLERAAAVSGQTLSEFVVGSARKAAEQTVRDCEVIALSERDSRALIDALLHPPAASPRLDRAIERYKAIMGDQ